jgi:hypothetical protein
MVKKEKDGLDHRRDSSIEKGARAYFASSYGESLNQEAFDSLKVLNHPSWRRS